MVGNLDFSITEDDKNWVEEGFKWLIAVYGYPRRQFKQVLFTKDFFPATFSSDYISIENLISDLSLLFAVKPGKVNFRAEKDVRDSYGIPYEFQGEVFECELEVVTADEGNTYILHFANNLIHHPERIVFNAVYYFIKISMLENSIEDAEKEEMRFLFFLAGVKMCFGVILAQTMSSQGRSASGNWETKWQYISPMPLVIMAYALALHESLLENRNPEWLSLLPSSIRNEYIKAEAYLLQHPSALFNKPELTALDLFDEGNTQYMQRDFDAAILSFQKATFLAQDNILKADLYNFIGYAQLRKQEYHKSITNFQKAIEQNPSYAYAYDNLGFAFIMSGDPESGKYYLLLAQKTAGNDPAYSFRNMALYFQLKGNVAQAEQYFQMAFEAVSAPVDLLELFYSKFLLELGKKEEALKWLRKAIEKDEPEALAFAKELNYTS